MKILQHVGDLFQDLLDVQNLQDQIAEMISSKEIEMIISGRSLMSDVQNHPLEISTKKPEDPLLLEMIDVQGHPDQVAEVINIKMKGDQDLLGLGAEERSIEMKGAPDHLDLVAEATNIKMIGDQYLLVAIDDDLDHLHIQKIEKTADMEMKGGDLGLQSNLDPRETEIIVMLPNLISVLESLV